jgi:hypothetical protein
VSTAARRRTGPRTTEGKRRSARNAFRHGLSLPVLGDPVTANAVEALTGRIAGAARNSDTDIAALARRVAQAQVDLIRIRRVRHELLAEALGHRGSGAQPPQSPDQVPDHVSNLVSKMASRLAAINRYERRALSLRKSAIRDFDTAVAAAASDPRSGRGQK